MESGKINVRRYVVCPHCDKGESRIDQLEPCSKVGPWYCDECGGAYEVETFAGGDVSVEKREGRKIVTMNLLILKPQQKPVYFVVQGMRFEGERWCDEKTPEDRAESARFFYEEHSCPTNWFEPEVVYFDGDNDPHGLIEFVAVRDNSEFPEDEMVGPNDRDRALQAFIESHASTPPSGPEHP